MLQATGWMGAFIFQIELDRGELRERQTNQVRIGGTLIIGINFTNRVFYPGRCSFLFPVCHFVPSLAEFEGKIVAI